MKSKLAVVLMVMFGLSMATVVFAQDAMNAEDSMAANTEVNENVEDTMAPMDAAANTEVPVSNNTDASSAPAAY